MGRLLRAVSPDRHTAPTPLVTTGVIDKQKSTCVTLASLHLGESSSHTNRAKLSPIGSSKDSGARQRRLELNSKRMARHLHAR
jgi:hypothetical protein